MLNLIQQGKICPYCNKPTQLVDSEIVYGTSYGLIYLCKPCKAYVGVHKGTEQALGRLANEELRELKKETHRYFDNLWNRKIEEGYSKSKSRKLAYTWLSEQMNIPFDECHVGMFDEERCKLAIKICKPYFKNI
jgi:hypothetical protein